MVANCLIDAICLMNKCSYFFSHQQGSGESKVKGSNMSGNNAPQGNVVQQCSACARVCAAAWFSYTPTNQKEKHTIVKLCDSQ